MFGHCLRNFWEREKRMNRFKNIIAISAFSLLILGLPAIASAQWRDRDDDDDDDNYGRGRYTQNIQGTVRNLKNRARNFERRTDRRDDRNDDRYEGRYGNRRNYGGNVEDLADRFARATDDLEDSYGRGRNLNNSADEARRVVDIARQIDQALYNTRGDRGLQNEWSQIRNDVRLVANTYGLNYNDRNRNNRSNGNGGWRSRVPFPLPY